tara:strand:- start:95 stop:589 length:495 start_codon:yes stop_codon:yes gene_type:complete
MEIIDNFLEPYYFKALQNIIIDQYFPWYTNPRNSISGRKKDGMYLTHMFYCDNKESPSIELLNHLIQKIPYDFNEIYRIKGNLYPSTQRKVFHGWHYDYEPPHQGCIFYMNTNNGYTVFKNKKVKSIENRLLLFDPSILHRSTTCTDAPARININFNYGVDRGR